MIERKKELCAALAASFIALAVSCVAPSGGSAMSETDAEIAARVAQRLAFDAGQRDQVFGVYVNGGIVTVKGTVSSEAERMRLLNIVRGTPGVSGVIDRLRIVR